LKYQTYNNQNNNNNNNNSEEKHTNLQIINISKQILTGNKQLDKSTNKHKNEKINLQAKT